MKPLRLFRAVSIARSKDTAPVVKRQRELIERLKDASESERMAISKELSVLASQASTRGRRDQPAKPAAPCGGREDTWLRRVREHPESAPRRKPRLEQEFAASRADIVKRFPDYLSLAEPAPLTVAETQKLLGEDEALVAILTGPESSLVWVVTRDGADWAEIEAGEAALAGEVKALRRGLEPQEDDEPVKLRYRPRPQPLPAAARPFLPDALRQAACDVRPGGSVEQLALPRPRHRAAAPRLK